MNRWASGEGDAVRSTVVDYLSGSTLRRRLLSGSTWALGGKIGAAVIGLITNGLLARLLGSREALGEYLIGVQHNLGRRGDRVFGAAQDGVTVRRREHDAGPTRACAEGNLHGARARRRWGSHYMSRVLLLHR